MTLRTRLQKTATRLIDKYGDTVQTVVIVRTNGATVFDPPTLTPTDTPVRAVVTGVKQWETDQTILASDLAVLVSGASPTAEVGGVIKIDGKNHTIIQRRDILATGVKSALKYFVRAGTSG